MESTIKVPVDTVRELYALMEEVNDLFHQPLYYKDGDRVTSFADAYYPSIHKAYYKTLWGLLPKEDRDRISEVDLD